MDSGPEVLNEEQAILKEGIGLILSQWHAMQLAVSWGGNSHERILSNVFDYFTQTKDQIDDGGLVTILENGLAELNTVADDGSFQPEHPDYVIDKFLDLCDGCFEGNYEIVEKLRATHSQTLVSAVKEDQSQIFTKTRAKMETKTIPKSMIAGIQSVMPDEITQNRKARSISVGDSIGVGIFKRTLNIVTYYKQEGDDSGWLAAGWIKESLGRALMDQPMLSGRLRRRTTVDGGIDFEVVPNDSGARLVEAKFPASLQEFLEMVKRDKTKAEAETMFWRDIDEVDPQFSPLFYVQVTNFESGGYSIGISCSILIADIILGTDFLTKWAKIQTSLANSLTTLKPTFYLPSHKQNLGNFLTESKSDSVLDRGELVVFRGQKCPKMSLACMKKSANVTRGKANSDVFIFIKDVTDDMRLEIISSNEAISDCDCDCGGDLEETYVGVLDKKLAFGERLEGTSCWIGSVSKGVVFIVPSTTLGDGKQVAKYIVALPKEEHINSISHMIN